MANEPSEAKLVPRFRLVGFFVFLLITCLYVLGAVFQLPFLRDSFQVDPTVLGILGGITLVLGGVEGISRLPGIQIGVPPKKGDDEST